MKLAMTTQRIVMAEQLPAPLLDGVGARLGAASVDDGASAVSGSSRTLSREDGGGGGARAGAGAGRAGAGVVRVGPNVRRLAFYPRVWYTLSSEWFGGIDTSTDISSYDPLKSAFADYQKKLAETVAPTSGLAGGGVSLRGAAASLGTSSTPPPVPAVVVAPLVFVPNVEEALSRGLSASRTFVFNPPATAAGNLTIETILRSVGFSDSTGLLEKVLPEAIHSSVISPLLTLLGIGSTVLGVIDASSGAGSAHYGPPSPDAVGDEGERGGDGEEEEEGDEEDSHGGGAAHPRQGR
jgi:hypothetical protein